MLTLEQQKTVEAFTEPVRTLARDLPDEAEGVALLELCHAVQRFNPQQGGLTIEQYIRLSVQNALNNWRRRERRAREMGVSGGAPTVGQMERKRSNGRRVRKTSDDVVIGKVRNLATALADPGCPDEEADNRLRDLVALLPRRLQRIALLAWCHQFSIRQIGMNLDINKSEIARSLMEARGYAELYLNGGKV